MLQPYTLNYIFLIFFYLNIFQKKKKKIFNYDYDFLIKLNEFCL
jgi:hypothetical protein